MLTVILSWKYLSRYNIIIILFYCPTLVKAPPNQLVVSYPPWAQNWCRQVVVMVVNMCNLWWKRLSILLAKKGCVYFNSSEASLCFNRITIKRPTDFEFIVNLLLYACFIIGLQWNPDIHGIFAFGSRMSDWLCPSHNLSQPLGEVAHYCISSNGTNFGINVSLLAPATKVRVIPLLVGKSQLHITILCCQYCQKLFAEQNFVLPLHYSGKILYMQKRSP